MNIDSQKYYKVVAKHSGKCLDVSGGVAAVAYNGSRVQQWDYVEGDNQKWRFQDADDGYYAIIVKNSTKCLDVEGGPEATGNGVGVQLWDYLGGANQKWRLQDAGDGTISISVRNSGKCLDVTGGPEATGNGVKVQQWDYVGSDNQKWEPIAVETLPEGELFGRRPTVAAPPDAAVRSVEGAATARPELISAAPAVSSTSPRTGDGGSPKIFIDVPKKNDAVVGVNPGVPVSVAG